MSASLGLGPTRCKICKLLSFLISWAILRVLLAAGTSSEGDGTTRQFREYFYGGVFSLGLGGGFFHYFPSSFSISSTCQVGHLDLEILLSHISSNFCDVFCWTLHPPRAVILSSSINGSGCSRLGCHHPVILLQHLQESKWKSLPKMSLPKMSLPKKMSFCSS